MPNNFERREIGKEIYFSKITDPRFKTNVISINFLAPSSEKSASENAVVSRYITKRSGKYPTYALMCNRLSAMYSAVMGGSVSMLGDAQVISLSINYIDSKYALGGENMNEMSVEMLEDCIFDPLAENGSFNKGFIELEKQSVVDDIESEINNKRYYAARRAAEIMYRDEPYALRELGTVEEVKRVSAESAYKAYLRILHHCRIEIICSGVSDFEDVEKKLTSLFAGLERKEIFPCKTCKSPLKPAPERATETLDVTQSIMILGFKTDCENDSALTVMNLILGDTPVSLLFKNVREKMSLCYYCDSGVKAYKGSASVSCGIDKENTEKAYKEILNQIKRMQNGDFTDEDVINAKMYRKNYLKTYNDSLNAIAVWYLVHIYFDDISSPEEIAERDGKVTKKEIIMAAQSLKLDTVYILTSNDND